MLDSMAANYFCLHPRWHDSSPAQVNIPWWTTGQPDIMIGTARSTKECALVISMIRDWGPFAAYLVTPSETVPSDTDEVVWSQHLWIDSSMIGDVMGGMWNVFVVSKFPVDILRQNAGAGTPDTLENLYRYHKREPLPGESMVTKVAPLSNSIGRKIIYKDSLGKDTYSRESQLSPFTLAEVQNASPQWHWFNPDAEPSLLEKLLLVDCHPIWFKRVGMPRNQIIDAVWRTTPLNIWTHVLFEILTKWSQGLVGNRQLVEKCVTEAPHLVGSRNYVEEPQNPEDDQPESECAPLQF